MVTRTAAILCLAIFLATTAFSAWSVNANISANRIGLDDNLTVTIIVSGDKLDNHSQPQLPSNDEWAFAGTNRSTSTNFQLSGGRMSKNTTYTYRMIISPNKKGNLTIPKIPVSANDETKYTQSFKVEVVDGSVTGGRQGGTRANRPAPAAPTDADVKERVFLAVNSNKTSAKIGEQITVTYTLYTQFELSNLSFTREPAFNGFWAEPLFRAKRLDYQRRVYNGETYYAVVLGKWAIFGLSSGEKTIEPMELQATALTRRDFFGFMSGGQNVVIKARPVTIDIEPLPGNPPAGFNGLVGDFSITAELKADSLVSNQAISYIMGISGAGNIYNLNAPELKFPSSFEEYGIQEGGNIDTKGAAVSGTKRFEYVLVPRSPGEFELPEVSLVYFDLGKNKYVTKTAGPVQIKIGQGDEMSTGNGNIISRGEVFRVGEDIRHIAPDTDKLHTGELVSPRLRTVLSFFMGEVAVFLVALIIRKRRDRLASDIGYARYTRALKRAMKELRSASDHFEDSKKFVATVQDALLHYLADRLGLLREGVVFPEIRDRLAERKVDDVILDDIEGLLERLNFHRFAPGEKETVSKELLKEAKVLIVSVDRVFK